MQLSDSGVSQSKKLAELADVAAKLKRIEAALEQAERLVFEQRQEGVICHIFLFFAVVFYFSPPRFNGMRTLDFRKTATKQQQYRQKGGVGGTGEIDCICRNL